VRVLLGERPPPLEGLWGLSATGKLAIMNCMQVGHACRQVEAGVAPLSVWVVPVSSPHQP
jgi:hypothetical protein